MENISGLLEYKGEDVEFFIFNDGLGFWQISFEGVDVEDNSIIQELHLIFGSIEITGELEEVKNSWAEIFESEGISFTFYGGKDHRDAETLFEKKNFLQKMFSRTPNINKKDKKLGVKKSKKEEKGLRDKINQKIKNGNFEISLAGPINFLFPNQWKFEKDCEEYKNAIIKEGSLRARRAVLVVKRDDNKVSFTRIGKAKGKEGAVYKHVEQTYNNGGNASAALKEFNKFFGPKGNDSYKKEFIKIVDEEDVYIWLSKGLEASDDLDYFIDEKLPNIFEEKLASADASCVDLTGYTETYKVVPPLLKKQE